MSEAQLNTDEYLPTRQSLLERLKNLEDQTSWQSFFDLYWKLIYNVARRTGLSDAEAQDVVQETILCVTRKIEGFTYDSTSGSFKGWLKRLTRWRVGDLLRKKQYQRHGQRLPREEPLETSVADSLAADSAETAVEQAWDEEWQRNLLEVALNRVKGRVSPDQYQIFYLHVYKGFPARQVAERLAVKPSEVYWAKYKVSGLVKKEIRALEKSMG